jgi:hypothetical protein
VQAEEIDVALDELETRLDRLRSLYEQYFLGIEKIEPAVARKDVDRRFWILRRTKIRNTARRFRLQTLIQRYNTFQQYWARICREIENGTYSRHILRAQKKLGAEPKTWAAKKRLGYFRKRGEGENGRASERPSSNEELGALLDGPMDLEAEAARAAGEALELAEARSRQPTASEAPPNRVVATESAPKARPEAPRRGALEMLDLDLDDGLGPSAAPTRAPAPARPQPLPKPAAPVSQVAPRPPPAPAAPAGPIARPSLPKPAPPATQVAPGPPPRPAPAASQVVERPRAPIPAAPPEPARVPLPRPVVQPERRPGPPQSPPAAPSGANITDERLKQIHAELSAAKRQAKQTDAVSLDALSRSLRESEKRIQAQHPGRSVDFHVVMKDGKPIVKPIVRK